MVAERALYPRLKVVIGAAMCTSVAMASMVPTPFLKPREYGLIGRADHLTLALYPVCMQFASAPDWPAMYDV